MPNRGLARRRLRALWAQAPWPLQSFDSLFPERIKASSQFLGFSFFMFLHDAADDGDLEALRDRIARGDDVDRRVGAGLTPLTCACISCTKKNKLTATTNKTDQHKFHVVYTHTSQVPKHKSVTSDKSQDQQKRLAKTRS